MKVLTPAADLPVIVQNGASGINSITLQRSGHGFAVWSVDTECKRNHAMVGYSSDGHVEVTYLPQEGEYEYVENFDKDYLTEVHITLPTDHPMDHWVVEAVWDKHGGWIVAFLLPTVGEMFTPEQIAMMRSEE